MTQGIALLGYALLGLLHQNPASGYDLRKIFTETPMAGFSDSPGAIYPALGRLEEKKLIRGNVIQSPGLRQRKLLRITPTGTTELVKWLTRPLTQADIANRLNELMLRFAFLDGVAGHSATLRFLQSFEAELKIYIPALKVHRKHLAPKMSISGRLALENGILGYEAQLQWASRAITLYEQKEKSK